jgi:hypothetical protein
MILREGFFNKQCVFTNGKIYVDGEEYKYEKIKEVPDYKLRIKVSLYLVIVFGPLILYMFINAMMVDIIPVIYQTFAKIKLALIIFGVASYAYVLLILKKEAKHYSCWKLGDDIATYLFVEQDEGEVIHNRLKKWNA